MATRNRTLWMLAKLGAAVAFWIFVGQLGLFAGVLAGIYKPDVTSTFRHLKSEHPVWTGAILVFGAALWLWTYSAASRRLQDAESAQTPGPQQN